MKTKSPVLILGDRWSGPLFARALKREGLHYSLWISDEGHIPAPDLVPIIVGNGETRKKAGLIFGEALAEKIWAISEGNWKLAQAAFAELRVPFFDRGLKRFGDEGAEKGIAFSSADFFSSAVSPADIAGRFSKLLGVGAKGGLEFEASLETSQGTVIVRAPVVIVATEKLERDAIPALSDKRIPVTLSSFELPAPEALDFSVGFFNKGADFAVTDGNRLQLGSYRNLFEDRAVGLHSQIDPVTRKNVLEFFSKRGWIADPSSVKSRLHVDSISCDGLPLVGPIPGLSGVIFATGFAGRAASFLFFIAADTATALSGTSKATVDVFSTRRLV